MMIKILPMALLTLLATAAYSQVDPGTLKTDTVKMVKSPLYYLDGKEITKQDLKEMDPNDIEQIEVLKDSSATNKFGAKGKDGVILITTKKKDPKAPDKKSN